MTRRASDGGSNILQFVQRFNVGDTSQPSPLLTPYGSDAVGVQIPSVYMPSVSLSTATSPDEDENDDDDEDHEAIQR